jgi:hypothetical protein
MQSIRNHVQEEHHYMIARWFTEFALVPLHFLAFVHQYTLAIWIGAATITIFIVASIRYLPQAVPVKAAADGAVDEKPEDEQA